MANFVFILGAGTSATAGCPLMLNFLDVAQELFARDALTPAEQESYVQVFKALDEMQGIIAKANIDVRNIESVLAALETGKLLGRLGTLSHQEVDNAPTHMRNLIVSVIERTTRFGNGEAVLSAPGDYHRFARLIKLALEKKHTVAVLTFNYDIAADFSLANLELGLDYHLEGNSVTTPSIPFFKLHGSLNWRRCSVQSCNYVEAFKLNDVCSNPSNFIQADKGKNITRLRMFSDVFQSRSHCAQPLVIEPVIVPPTWDKTRHYEAITPVWRGAANYLSAASHIFVCGYSFPDTDVFFRYLFAVGGSAPSRLLKRFHVFNPNEEVGERFRSLLGPAVSDRFVFSNLKFARALDEIKNFVETL